jgi:4-phytase/acid phosphatase
MKGPINIASTLAENLLLEYTEGMDRAQVGWGCVDHDKLQSLLTLHTAATDFTNRTPAIARAQSAGLLRAIGASLQQAAKGTAEPGAVGKPSGRVAILVGHDTNLENIAGALGLTWVLDGRRDDTPPGSALVFELWTMPGGASRVKLSFTAQTLEQMRESLPLSLEAPPARVPVFVPACSTEDMSCSLAGFLAALPASGVGARSQAASR